MEIYDRWGGKVFSTTDYVKGWQGSVKSAKENTGVYIWICTYQFRGEEKKVQKGTVVIVK